MTNEYNLSFTVNEIDERLGKIDNLVSTVNGVAPDANGNVVVQGGAASWNDLKDRPFGEEAVVVIPEQTLENFEMMNDVICAVVDPFIFNMSVGDMYTIIWDGISYECVVEGFAGMTYLGNMNYVMMQNGGDIPFALIFTDSLFVATEKMGSHTISIKGSNIHHIDPKYIKDMYYETVDQVLDHYIAEGSWSTGYFSALISVNNAIFLDPTKEYILTDHTTGISAHVTAQYVAPGGSYGTPDNYDSINYQCTDGSEGRHLGLTYYKSDNRGNPGAIWYHHGSTGSGDEHEISLCASESILVPIKEKYIPDTIARKSDVESMISWKKLLDKPFGDEYACEVIVDTREVTFDPYYASIEEIDTGYFANDCDVIRVTFDEVVYILPRYTASYDGWNYYGNAWISFGKNANEHCENVDDTTTPFCISFSDIKFSGELMIQVEDQLPYHTVKIEQVIEYSAITLDEKYIPDTIARISDVEDMISEINVGSAPSDWNASEGTAGHVLNRTHYEEVTTVGGDTLTWDGNTEGLECPMFGYYKVSDIALTLDDLVSGCTVVVVSNGESATIDIGYEMLQMAHEMFGAVTIMDDNSIYALSIATDGFEQEGAVFSKGTYFTSMGGYVTSLTIPGYTGFKTTTTTLKTLDPKYLPEALHFGEDKAFEPIVWDVNGVYETVEVNPGNGTLLKYCKVADFFNATVEMFDTLTAVISGETMSVPANVMGEVIQKEHGWEFAEGSIFASDGQQTFVDVLFPRGIWMNSVGEGTYMCLTPATTVKPMDEKYMPILTSPSGKKFKLTVDDSGAVSAVEVTE